MRGAWCLVVALGWPVAGCAPHADRTSLPRPALRAPETIRVRYLDSGRRVISDVALEDYVHGSILSEFAPPSGDPAVMDGMLQVQAVIARTYAIAHLGRHGHEGFDLCATTHCQLYEPERVRTSRWRTAAALAVQRTAGSVLWFQGGAASALFHADCGGHTSTPVEVWGGHATPYLASLADDGPAESAHASWQYAAAVDAVRRALNARAATRVGARLVSIAVIARDRAGRAERVGLTGERDLVVRGDEFREALTSAFGPRSIKSAWFDVSLGAGDFTFTGRGFGHGVGLCQSGALARIKAGTPVHSVLQRYYPGTTIVTLG